MPRESNSSLFDVDGVLTDGKIWIFPAPAGAKQSVLEQANRHGGEGGFGFNSASLIEAKGFHAHDGNATLRISKEVEDQMSAISS